MSRKYYSVRNAKNPLTVDGLKMLFGAVFRRFEETQYFDEAFGFYCVDRDWTPGTIGRQPDVYFLQHLRKSNLWPIKNKLDSYNEDDVFDVIELLYDLVSEPLEGTYHSYENCGMHYSTFNQPSGRTKFRSEINEILADYKDGYELAETGEIVEKADKGVDTLLSAKLPSTAQDVQQRLEEATALFRRRHATISDRHNAVKMLADILEGLRPRLKKVLTNKDEGDLFNIANNFEIRHRNEKQKNRYDKSLWLSWMFYFYVATLHFAVRKMEAGGPDTK
jgi:hypothetical protein